jgi:hypothetical protein
VLAVTRPGWGLSHVACIVGFYVKLGPVTSMHLFFKAGASAPQGATPAGLSHRDGLHAVCKSMRAVLMLHSAFQPLLSSAHIVREGDVNAGAGAGLCPLRGCAAAPTAWTRTVLNPGGCGRVCESGLRWAASVLPCPWRQCCLALGVESVAWAVRGCASLSRTSDEPLQLLAAVECFVVPPYTAKKGA